MQYQAFNSATTELHTGINLIEASAGTGKTYAIAMLALRFIVEKNIPVDNLLIVTFTKAATGELKERVRTRLSEARQALNGRGREADKTIMQWLERLDIEPDQIRQRIELALLDIDRAGIFTIHGFCQRVLQEHALESGQLFDVELSDDVDAIRQACADDFWRKQVYPRDQKQANILLDIAKTPDALLASIKAIKAGMIVHPVVDDLDSALQTLLARESAAKVQIRKNMAKLLDSDQSRFLMTPYVRALNKHRATLHSWCQENNAEAVFPGLDALYLFTHAGIMNGLKFRKTKSQTPEQRKLQYLDELSIGTAAVDACYGAYQKVGLSFRRGLHEFIEQTLQQRLQRLNLLSFDDLIGRLHDILTDGAAGLIEVLRKRFKVALIDEFQDTDQQQWFIFSNLFAHRDGYLFLIGDPKQAIYRFRGADIFSYFNAQQQAEQHYTLDKNWRSHPDLVGAVNRLFENTETPFLFEQLPFKPVQAARTAGDGALLVNDCELAPMQIWQFAKHASREHWNHLETAYVEQQIRIAVVNEILHLLVPGNGFRLTVAGEKQRPLNAEDIAILVYSHKQARSYQKQLSQAGVISVLHSTESVFASQTATRLLFLLRAIARPGHVGLLKQALTLEWFALDGPGLLEISQDEQRLDAWLSRFQDYHRCWQSQGLMAMMLGLLARERIQEKLSRARDAQRQLTDLYHLLELLQQATIDEHLGINKTLDWLNRAMQEARKGEQQRLRLESDARAVKIITMHSAKGLEYPVVFCPCLWQHKHRSSGIVTCHEQGRFIADLGSEMFIQRQQQALQEQLAEELRLLYVALTRAKYRCYLVWADMHKNHEPNTSALAGLLFNQQPATSFCEQQKILQALCQQEPSAFHYRLLPSDIALSDSCPAEPVDLQISPRQRRRLLQSHWSMSSYTALSALSVQESPETPLDKAREPVGIGEKDDQTDTDLPKGAQTGNVVHVLLETLEFDVLAGDNDISREMESACLRYGLSLDEKQSKRLRMLLKNTVLTPLSEQNDDFFLAKIASGQCLKEMPFYLSMQALDTRKINALLQDSPGFQALSFKQMQGYLTGFIDLVCLYQGRYYLMDYKTNSLEQYAAQDLTSAMREHNYGLQYWLYTVVLHRYLQQRVPDYRYESHFGGVRYLFVRGMQANTPMSGVYQDYPDFTIVQALSELFTGEP